jgi:hypothetical protein
MKGNIFPVIIILLFFAASIESLIAGDLRLCVYWLAAGVLNIAVIVK